MVTIKEAVLAAINFAQDTLGIQERYLLEEVESQMSDGVDSWLITLSMPARYTSPIEAFGKNPKVEYKTFVVSKETGTVQSMRIRQLANV